MGGNSFNLDYNKQGTTGKKPRFFKVFKKQLVQEYNYGIKKNLLKKSDDDNGGFQQQSPQRLLDRYDHMNSRNKRQDLLCLKPIEAKYYYSIRN